MGEGDQKLTLLWKDPALLGLWRMWDFSGSGPSLPPLSEVRSRQALLATGLRCVFARRAARTALPLRWMWLQAVDFHGSHQARIPVKHWTAAIFPVQQGVTCDVWSMAGFQADSCCPASPRQLWALTFSKWKTVTLEGKPSEWNEKKTFITAL